MSVIISGKINTIFPNEIVTSNFEKRVIWIDEISDNPYPNTWEIEFQQGACNKLDGYSSGQMVDIKVNIRGRLLQKKATGENFIINTLNGWDIRLQQNQFSQPQQNTQQQQSPQQQQQNFQQPQQNQYNQQQQFNNNQNKQNNGGFQCNTNNVPDDLPF